MNIHRETKFGEHVPEFYELPFAPLLPKDPVKLMKLRLYVRMRCLKDPKFRADVDWMCSQDVVLWVTLFGYMHETRETETKIGEFEALLDPDQQDILAILQKYAGRWDMVIEKTRGIGLSYIIGFYGAWLFIYNPNRISIGYLSKDETSLDQVNQPFTLLGKIDLCLASLPAWMTHDANGEPIVNRVATRHRFINKRNGNTIIGFVPEDQKLRSARLHCLFPDEGAFLDIDDQKWLASAYGVTPSIIWVSTHNGTATLFYRNTKNSKSDLVRVSAWWWANPRCRRGMYKVHASGEIEILDKNYEFPPDYFLREDIHEPFLLGRLRSPWVDRHFFRSGISPVRLLEEYYGVTGLESRKLVSSDAVATISRQSKPPLFTGRIESGRWIDDPDGAIYFWTEPETFVGFAVLGVDPNISGGSDGAYAAAVGIDCRTGVQVCSIRQRHVPAHEFPDIVVDLAEYLSKGRDYRSAGHCQIAFESQGSAGVIFREGLDRRRYRGVCQDDGKSTPGFGNTDRGVSWIIEVGRAVLQGEFFPRDKRLTEIEHFEFDDDWEITYAGTDGHGDLAIAAGVAWHGAKKRRQAILHAERAVNSGRREYLPEDPEVHAWYNGRGRNELPSQVWDRRIA